MGINYNFSSFLEWEGLQEQYEFKKAYIPEKSININKITISRDEEYNIKGFIYGDNNPDFHSNDAKGMAGQRINPLEITGSGKHGIQQFNLRHCYIGGVSTSHKLERDEQYTTQYQAELRVFEVEKKTSTESEANSLTEWFLNGPNQDFLFCRSTERVYSEKYHLERSELKNKEINGESVSHDRDYLLVELTDFKFIIQQVPKELGPKWSNNIGIEYRKEFGRIPNESEREGISEIVSFIFGKHLLKVGYTEYDENGYLLKQISQNPWGNNVVSKCRNSGSYPIKIDNYDSWGRAETLLSELVPKYLEYREELNLKNALWSFWISDDVPVGTNIPIIANALEILKKGWFKSNKSKTKGVYLPKSQFDQLLNESFEEIERKLSGLEYADRMLRRMKGSFNMGVNESLDFFFDEIGLPIGDVDKKAIAARNAMIHDKHGTSEEALDLIIFYSKVYKTLFHRVFLKLLSYDGSYIDYSIIGWPEKHINEVTNVK
ncbi:hypothetical protein [Paenibacillus sp. GCM10028914]|uniref:hypothetical protein n=1 Tax=Paenibacillus sp. GCM10028914 TaxID=3273416 RepID=UPI003607574E